LILAQCTLWTCGNANFKTPALDYLSTAQRGPLSQSKLLH